MGLRERIMQSIEQPQAVEGPIEVTEASYPFCSMSHCRKPYDLGELGYSEEEYFVSGHANVYDIDEKGDMYIKEESLPYKTRVLVRKPKRQEDFSGRVYLDILNATNGYDHEDLWTRIYEWCVRNGHGYIGITSKPLNVAALKTFDYERYQSLDWSAAKKAPQPAPLVYASIPGTEEGLFWDMLSQTANTLKGGKENFFDGWEIRYLYLTGQSQSGAYLNTYIHYFDVYVNRERESALYDGYLNIVGAQMERKICQDEVPRPMTLWGQNAKSVIPFVSVACEGDFYIFKAFGVRDIFEHCPKNADGEDDKCRYYEVAGSPHFDCKCPVIVCDEDIRKAGRIPHSLNREQEERLNDFPLACYIVGLLEKLHLWAAEGKVPEIVGNMERDGDGTNLARDKDGNAIGGLRSPFMEVPIAAYHGSDPQDDMGTIGTMKYFSAEMLTERYGSAEKWLERFVAYTDKQVKEGWIVAEDAEKMKQWAKDRSETCFA